jgi:hypothetical protein
MALTSVWLLSGMKHLPLIGRGLPWVPTPSGTYRARTRLRRRYAKCILSCDNFSKVVYLDHGWTARPSNDALSAWE